MAKKTKKYPPMVYPYTNMYPGSTPPVAGTRRQRAAKKTVKASIDDVLDFGPSRPEPVVPEAFRQAKEAAKDEHKEAMVETFKKEQKKEK